MSLPHITTQGNDWKFHVWETFFGHQRRFGLKEHIQGGRVRSLFRSALVITEIALALALLTSSSLLLRSFAKLLEVRPGFNPNNILTMKLSLSQMTGVEPGRVPSVSKSILDRVRTLPGVLHAAISTGSPFAPSGFATTFEVRDRHLAAQDPDRNAVAYEQIR
jgi:hypothetical protein